MSIIISMDKVEIEGQTITRPSYISRGAWLSLWEDLNKIANNIFED